MSCILIYGSACLLTSPSDSDTVISYHKQPAMIDLGFLLNGRLNHRLQGDLTDDLIEADSGIAGIGFFPGRKGVVEIVGDPIVQVLHIHITTKRLYEMVCDDLIAMPPTFRKIFKGNIDTDYLSRGRMDPAVRAVVLDIFKDRGER